MSYSVELYFEHDFEQKLRSLWDDLAKVGVPSILQKIGSRPHLSLLILDECDAEKVAGAIEDGIRGQRKFPVTFPAVSLLPGRQQTVFLTPSVNAELVAMQGGLHSLLDKTGCLIREHYRPRNWLPHCSISKELSAADAIKTLEICQKSPPTGETRITEIGFIEFRPRKVIRTMGLRDGS